MSHDKATYTPILSAARQEQLTALRADVRRKLAAYRERRDQSATVLFQHLAYLRFDFILDEADELHAAYNDMMLEAGEYVQLIADLTLKLDSYRALVASVVDSYSAPDAVKCWLKGVSEKIEAPEELVACHCDARSENECTCY